MLLQFTGGGTAIKTAMLNVNREVTAANRDRAEAKKVMVLLTDGHFNVDQDPVEQFVRLGRKRRRFFACLLNFKKTFKM